MPNLYIALTRFAYFVVGAIAGWFGASFCARFAPASDAPMTGTKLAIVAFSVPVLALIVATYFRKRRESLLLFGISAGYLGFDGFTVVQFISVFGV